MDAYARRLSADSRAREQPATTLQDSPVLSHPPLLSRVFEQVPQATLLSLALVSRHFNAVATDVLLSQRPIRLDSARAVEHFERLALEHPQVGHRIRAFEVTKSSLLLCPALSTLAPNLRSLSFAASTSLNAATLADFLLSFPALQQVSIVGQDARSRRRRIMEAEPEGEIGKGLRSVANIILAAREETEAEDYVPFHLKTLRLLSTPIKLSSLDYFLEVCGGELEELSLEGCSLGPNATHLVEQWCPRLQELRLDTLIPTSAPPSTPRPNLPPLEFDLTLPWNLSTCLTSLHLASLPSIAPSAFALFSETAYASLESLSISQCDFSAAHLSHFTRVRRLKVVACHSIKSIPIFPDLEGRPEAGAGCKELRTLSILGCTGLTLGNLWELAMLSRLEIGKEEQAERRTLGLGGRGLKKLTVDGTQAREHHYNVSGFAFTLPAGLGLAPSLVDLPSALPHHLAPSPHTLPYFDTNLLSPSLPSFALLATLVEALDLEELSLFGSIGVVDIEPLQREEPEISYLARVKDVLLASMSYVPLLGSYLGSRNVGASAGGPPIPFRGEKGEEEIGGTWGPSDRRRGGFSAGRSGSRLTAEELDWARKEGSGRLKSVHV